MDDKYPNELLIELNETLDDLVEFRQKDDEKKGYGSHAAAAGVGAVGTAAVAAKYPNAARTGVVMGKRRGRQAARAFKQSAADAYTNSPAHTAEVKVRQGAHNAKVATKSAAHKVGDKAGEAYGKAKAAKKRLNKHAANKENLHALMGNKKRRGLYKLLKRIS